MMKIRGLLAAVSPGLICLFIFLAAGCEDKADLARHDRMQRINQAASSYQAALAAENRSDALRDAAGELAAYTAERDGAAAAAAMIEASARRDLVLAKLDEIAALRGRNRSLRTAIAGTADAAQQTGAVAASLAAFDGTPIQSAIDQQVQEFESALQSAMDLVNKLQEQVNELATSNQADHARIAQLRDRSRAHRERAFELGDGPQGHAQTEQAVTLDLEADRAENVVAQRNVLLMGLESELGMAQTRAGQIETQITAARAAEQGLAADAASYAEGAAKLDTQIQTLRTKFSELWNESQSIRSDLDTLEAEVESELDKAISQANAAVSTESGDAARVLKARLLQLKGDFHAGEAEALSGHAALLGRLAGVEAFAEIGNFANDRRQTMRDRDARAEAARQAYTEAAETLDTVSGRAQQDVAFMKAQLQALATGAADATVIIPWMGSGAASPEELATALRRADSWETLLRTSLDNLYIELGSQVEYQAAVQINGLVVSLADLSDAMREKFGKGLAEAAIDYTLTMQQQFQEQIEQMQQMEQMQGQLPPGAETEMEMPAPMMFPMQGFSVPPVSDFVGGIRVGSLSRESGTLIITGVPGQTESGQIPIARKNDRWFIYIDRESLEEGVDAGMAAGAGAGAGVDAPFEMPEWNEQTATQMIGLIRIARPIVDRLTQRVQAGEFASIDACMDALAQDLQQSMGGAFGGFGG